MGTQSAGVVNQQVTQAQQAQLNSAKSCAALQIEATKIITDLNTEVLAINAKFAELQIFYDDVIKPLLGAIPISADFTAIIKALEQLILSYCAPYQKQMATYIAQSEAKIKAQLELVKAMLEGHDSKTGIKCHINLVDKDGKPLMSIVPLHL